MVSVYISDNVSIIYEFDYIFLEIVLSIRQLHTEKMIENGKFLR